MEGETKNENFTKDNVVQEQKFENRGSRGHRGKNV
jgi:hypothetical protein